MNYQKLKLSLATFTTLVASMSVIAAPEACKPNDYCVNVKLENITQPHVKIISHVEGTAMGRTFNQDFPSQVDNNFWDKIFYMNIDVAKNNITQFKYVVKSINGTPVVEPCHIVHDRISQGVVNTIYITNYSGKYVCRVEA